MSAGLPLMKSVLTSLAKKILVLLGLSDATILRNALTGRGVIRTGKGVLRALENF